jgi:hypothetical protein
MQPLPQRMPAGVDVTVPLPVTETVTGIWFTVNVAATCVACVSAMVHFALLAIGHPVQPEKLEPVAGAAVSVTVVP